MIHALLTLLLVFAPALSDEVRRELAAADPAGQGKVLEGLPARMFGREPAERRDLLPLLLGILRDPARGRLHAAAIPPLVATGTSEGVAEALKLVYAREESPLREAARTALAADRSEATSVHLAAALRADRSPRARALIALVLGARGAKAAPAAEALVAALSDEWTFVRGAAAEALVRIYRECRGFSPAAWRERVRAGPPPAEDAVTTPGDPGVGPTAAAPVSPDRALRDLNPDFHGIPLDRGTVIAVIDFSRSVRGPDGARARQDLARALALLPSNRRFTVLAFDDRLLSLSSAPETAGPDAKERLGEFLSRLPPGQRTELLTPLRTAMELARAAAGEAGAQVLVVSDGQATVMGPPLEDLLERAKGLSEAGVRVDAAVLGGARVGLFGYLANLTGGRCVAL